MINILRRLFGDQPDPAWAPTGVRAVFTGHDESKASAVFAAEQKTAQAKRDASRRALASVQRKAANVARFERKAAR